MTLWLRSRRIWIVAIGALVVVVVVPVVGGVLLPVPGLLSVGLAVPIGLMIPLVGSTALAYGLSGGNPRLESAAVRRIRFLDASLVAAVSVLVLVGLAVFNGPDNLGLGAARNTLGFVGLFAVGRWLHGEAAAATLPVATLLLMAAFGADPSGRPRAWAWLLTDGLEVRSWLAAGLVWAIGLGCLAIPRRVP